MSYKDPAKKAEKAAYDHARVPEKRAAKKLYDLEYCRKNRVKKNEQAKQWYRDHPDQVRNTRLKRYFNLTLELWNAKFAAQDFKCAICLTSTPDSSGWHTDHDHTCCPGIKSCGKCIRGILCGAHNKGTGHFQDSPELLRAAADYIERWRAYAAKYSLS